MKRIILIVLILALVGGMVLVPMFNKRETTVPAVFDFQENLATEWNTIVPLSFTVTEEVEKVEIVLQDSIFNTFRNPKGKVKFNLNAGFYGLGTRTLLLKAYLKNGETYEDERLIRVLSDVVPAKWRMTIENTFPHKKENFTQGLEFDGNVLYEGTGDPDRTGQTLVGPIDIATGEYTKKMGLDANYFGEGITILGDQIYQLTYTQGKCFVYNKATLQLIQEFTYAGEGWGLCNDGEFLYMSDGSERIYKRDPKTFEVIETIEVYDNTGPIGKLNELEFVDGLIYANVWMTQAMVVIQPENGKVLAVIDAGEAVRLGANGGDVLNGIAYRKADKKLFITGKYWTKLFEVRIEK